MLNTSLDLRFLATLRLHENQAQLDTRRADANNVAGLQRRRTVDAMTIKKGAVSALVGYDAASVTCLDGAMPS